MPDSNPEQTIETELAHELPFLAPYDQMKAASRPCSPPLASPHPLLSPPVLAASLPPPRPRHERSVRQHASRMAPRAAMENEPHLKHRWSSRFHSPAGAPVLASRIRFLFRGTLLTTSRSIPLPRLPWFIRSIRLSSGKPLWPATPNFGWRILHDNKGFRAHG